MSGLVMRPAQRSSAKPLIGLYAESGAGKTYSALHLARGFVGPKGKIVMIETESGRGEALADILPGGYEVIPLSAKTTGFSPKVFGEAFDLAESKGADALVIDSGSHEWEGVGGVLDMAAQNQAAGKKGPLVWQVPKIDHQKYFTGRMLQTPIKLVVLCLRAKYPMEEKEKNGRKDWVRSELLSPKQSEDILHEMFVHGYIEQGTHFFRGTKYTRPDLEKVLVSGQPISIATGEALAKWAAGGTAAVSPSLSSILTAIKIAENLEQLNAVRASAALLAGEDKDKATAAFKAKRESFK